MQTSLFQRLASAACYHNVRPHLNITAGAHSPDLNMSAEAHSSHETGGSFAWLEYESGGSFAWLEYESGGSFAWLEYESGGSFHFQFFLFELAPDNQKFIVIYVAAKNIFYRIIIIIISAQITGNLKLSWKTNKHFLCKVKYEW